MNHKEADDVFDKIKSRGYWHVTIRPLKFEKERIKSLEECASIVRECEVRLRGWYYPHYGKDEPTSGLDWVESRTDWALYKEIWRMYQSGQFVHLFCCIEDWFADDVAIFGTSKYSSIQPGSVLDIFSTLYSLTEIYEFASRLAQRNLFDTGLRLSVDLYGMKKRKLAILESGRFPFHRDYICEIANLPKSHLRLKPEEFVAKRQELALEHALWIYERFNWRDPSKEILVEVQNKLLERRL